MGTAGDIEATKGKIRSTIQAWVLDNSHSLSDFQELRYDKCATYIQSKFPSINSSEIPTLSDLFHDFFKTHRDICDRIKHCPVPAIIYSGDESLLPEIFSRINVKGVTLNKYQILAAAWTTTTYKITDDNLLDLLIYVSKFYSSITSEGFSLSEYDEADFLAKRTLNLYQIIFGFGKLLTQKYPALFGVYSEQKNVESCGFNLINACLANKNSKLSELSNIVKANLKSDDEVNTFLLKILECAEIVDKIIKPYAEFKLNSRNQKPFLFHAEMQICSIIANLFIARYVTLVRDENGTIIGRKIDLSKSSQKWKNYLKDFKKNFFRVYLTDLLNDRWAGTGDKLLDDIAINSDYYTRDIDKTDLDQTLSFWFKTNNDSRLEYSKVASVSNVEKLLLCIIYNRKLNAYDQLSNSKYDIEHLSPKNMMKNYLLKFSGDQKLPISSFGNLCLLPEWDNRKKKDKTLYQDEKYLSAVGDRLSLIENEFSFTSKDDLDWANNKFDNFASLKNAYMSFIEKRFSMQKKILLTNLYSVPQNHQ